MKARKRVRPLASFPFNQDLLDALAAEAKAKSVPQALIVRRALRAYLEDADALKPIGKVFGPTSREKGRIRFKTIEEAQESWRPGDELKVTTTGGVVIERRQR